MRSRASFVPLFAVLLPAAACAPAQPAVMEPASVVDLTYPFDDQTIYWPHNARFQWTPTAWGPNAAGYWYASADFSTAEHGGTHIDAPIHFGAGRETVDAIPVERLIGPAAVIDVRPQCAQAADYAVSAQDILDWETAHGRLQPSDLVLLFTGWGAHWPDPRRYLGSDTPDNAATLHFPGLAVDAASMLLARGVRGVGIDTASIDPGNSVDFSTHRALNRGGLYALEDVAALDRLPARGATVYALPMKIRGGTGGPTRIIAVLPGTASRDAR